MFLYKIAHFLFGLTWKIFYRFKVEGRENIPMQGGVIIAANHISSFDPPVVGCAVPLQRQVYFMAKEELFANTLAAKILRTVGAFPVKRGMPDRTALKNAIDILSQGKVLGLFPEGTRSKDGTLREAEPGLALMANKAGAVIVPTAIKGTAQFGEKKKLFPQIIVKFGQPIVVNKNSLPKDEMLNLGKKVMSAINDMLKSEEVD